MFRISTKEAQNGGALDSVCNDIIVGMVGFGFVRLFFEQVVVKPFLLLFKRVDLCDGLALGYFQIGVFFLEPEQLLKAGCEVAIFFEVDFSEFLKTVQTKELGNFPEPLLPDVKQFIQHFLDLLDKINFCVLAVIQRLYLSVQQVVFLFLGIKQRLNPLNVFCSSGASKRFQVILNFVKLLADLVDFVVLLFQLWVKKDVRFCQWP